MKHIFLLLTVIFLCSCSTLSSLSVGRDVSRANCEAGDYIPRVYSGAFNDIRILKNTFPGEFLFIITDFPFSLVLDTVVLPYTIPTQIAWGNLCPTPSVSPRKQGE